MKKLLVLLLALTLIFSVVACGKKEAGSNNEAKVETPASNETEKKPENKPETKAEEQKPAETASFPVTVTDGHKREVVIEKKPERIVAVSGTTLNILSKVGGKAVAGPSLSPGAPKPDYYESIEHLGHMASIDAEKLISLNPDLVLMQAMSGKIVPILEENNIPYFYFSGKTFDEIKQNLMDFAKMIGNEEEGKKVTEQMDADMNDIMSKIPKGDPMKVAIIHVTGQGISLELNNSIAGDLAKRMGLQNITEGTKPERMGSTTTPFSLEAVVEANPDAIFVTSMISSDQDQGEVLMKHIQDNDAWNAVPAVKDGKIYYLPQTHFLFNPIDKFPEAAKMMAEHLWPEAFK